jgi:hypothetical protein
MEASDALSVDSAYWIVASCPRLLDSAKAFGTGDVYC